MMPMKSKQNTFSLLWIGLGAIVLWLFFTFFKKGGLKDDVKEVIKDGGDALGNLGDALNEGTDAIKDWFTPDVKQESYVSDLEKLKKESLAYAKRKRSISNEEAKKRARMIHDTYLKYNEDEDLIVNQFFNSLSSKGLSYLKVYLKSGFQGVVDASSVGMEYLGVKEFPTKDKAKSFIDGVKSKVITFGDYHAMRANFGLALDDGKRDMLSKILYRSPELDKLMQFIRTYLKDKPSGK